MKRFFYAAVAAGLASLALIASASANVPRTQPTATLTVALTAIPGNVHTFTITWTNPCGSDGAFTGIGQGSTTAGGANETITGTLVGDHLTFTAIYTSFIPGYTYTYDGSLAGGGLLSIGYAATFTFVPILTWTNHGDYVAAQGGGSDAAHSCIGVPTP